MNHATIIMQSRAEAFKAAVTYLRATASAFREMASRVDVSSKNPFLLTANRRCKAELEAKAQLLDGQADHIEGLV